MSFPIVDSHIHLYAKAHIDRLGWTANLPDGHPLNRQNSIEEYRKATQSERLNVRGFVFLEVDRKSGLHDYEWEDALAEVDFLVRIAEGKPIEGEGHSAADQNLVLGIVPWAPVPAEPGALATYLLKVQNRAGKSYGKIKGFRYLLQDKPAGTMLSKDFISNLKAIGWENLAFDLGVDARSGGLHQLEEACEMLDQVYTDGTDLRLIINHLCKPDLHITPEQIQQGNPTFVQWKKCITRMASHEFTFMKLSGLFSELPPQEKEHSMTTSELLHQTKPWVDAVFAAFGPSRIMFGSDWPVCNVGGPGVTSWSYYTTLIAAILEDQELTDEEKSQVWSGTAVSAYDLAI